MFSSEENYFSNLPIFDFQGLIKEDKPLYAHLPKIEGTKEPEPLKAHLDLSIEYLQRLSKEKNLDSVLENFEKKLLKNASETEVKLWREMLLNVLYMHDVGKINPNFQRQKMQNKAFKKTESNNSNHSFFSAILYFDVYLKKLEPLPDENYDLFFVVLLLNTFVIQKHHSTLDGFDTFLEKLDDQMRDCPKELAAYKNGALREDAMNLNETFEYGMEALREKAPQQCVELYIYLRFVYSLLVACDFYATSDYMNNAPVKDFGILGDIEPYLKAFNAKPVTQSIRSVKKGQDPTGDINILRSQMFLEAEENLLNNSDAFIMNLEAPTGSGKTITSVNLGLQLLKKDKSLNRIHYVFPFNTLVEQTKSALEDCFGEALSVNFGVINSITPIKTYPKDTEDGEWDYKGKVKTDYEKSLLARQFQHYPIVLTTHVHFFESLFGIRRENTFPIPHLANSVIILDEIQSYNNKIWKEIIIFLKAYAQLLNFKVIIMSATLPDLNQLSLEEDVLPQLITNRGYYYGNPLFKNRVHVDFSMLSIKKDKVFEGLLEKVLQASESLGKQPDLQNKIVVEFIKKASALQFFKELVKATQDTEISVELMTGDDHKAERKRIINRVKTEGNIILVATQVIEAGVDIDMDAGFKDISMLDSEEQFLGRINRSCLKKKAVVYFFNRDPAEAIYRGDVRKKEVLTLKQPEIQQMLMDKDFSAFYEKVLEALEQQSKKENASNLKSFWNQSVWHFNCSKVKERMALIDDRRKRISLFLNTTITTETGETLCGATVFQAYEALLTDAVLSYAEKRVKLSDIQAKMDYFIYEIDKGFADGCALSPNGLLGELYYFEEGEKYFENGKFSREKLKSESLFE